MQLETNVDTAVDNLFADAGVDAGADEGTGAEVDASAAEETAVAADTSGIEEPPAEEPVEAAAAEEPPAEVPPADPAAPVTDLPEGVRVYDRHGKQFWAMSADAGKAMYAAQQQLAAVEQVLGEKVTPQVIERHLKDTALLDRMELSFRGSAEQQEDMFRYFMRNAEDARRRGDISHDPVPAAVDSFLAVVDKQRPEVIDNFKARIIEGQVKQMYRKAKASGDQKLFNTAQHMDRHFFGKYQKWETYQAEAAPDPREQDIARREEALRTQEQTRTEREWKQWESSSIDANKRSVSGEISKALQPYQKSFEKFPETLRNIQVRLDQEVREAISKDELFQSQNDTDYRKAQATANPEARAKLRQSIEQRYARKAAQVIGALVSKVVSESSNVLKAQSTANNNRRQQAAGQQRISGGSPQRPSATQGTPNGGYDRRGFEADVEKLFANI